MVVLKRICFILVLAAAGGCDFSGADEARNSVDLLLSVEALRTTVVVSVLDAETGLAIEGPKSVVLTGGDSQAVVDGLGSPVQRISTDSPHMAFGIAPPFRPSRDRPLAMQVSVRAQRYMLGGARITLDRPGHHVAEVRLLPAGRPVEGVLVGTTVGGFADNGRIEEGVQVVAGPGSAAGGFAALDVPKGLHARSFGGKPADGVLRATVRYVSGGSGWLPDVIPGGASTFVWRDKQVGYPMGITAGAFAFFSLHDASAEGMGYFSSLIEWRATVDEQMFHPYIGRTVQEGDAIDLFAWDEGRGAWIGDGSTVLIRWKDRLGVRVQTDKLTAWAIGFATGLCQHGRLDMENNVLGGELRLFSSPGDRHHGVITLPFAAGAGYADIPRPPSRWQGVAQVTHGVDIVELPFDNLCGQVLTARFPAINPRPDSTRLSMHLDPCPALQVTDYSTWTVLYRRIDVAGAPIQDASGRTPGYRRVENVSLLRDVAGRVVGAEADLAGLPEGARYEFVQVVGRHSDTREAQVSGGQVELRLGELLQERGLCARR